MSAGPRPPAAAPRRTLGGLGLLLLAVLVGALAGALWGLSERPRYAAVATAIIADRGTDVELVGAGAVGAEPALAGERLLELARSEEVGAVAAARLGGDVPGADLLADTGFRVGGDGATLVVRSTATSADVAAAAANAFAAALVEVVAERERRRLRVAEQRLDQRIAEVDPLSTEAEELERRRAAVSGLRAAGDPLGPGREAELPDGPENGRPVARSALVGGAVGLLLGVLMLTLLRGRPARPRPIRGAGDLEAALGAPTLVTLADPEAQVHAPGPGEVEVSAAARADLEPAAAALWSGEDAPRSLALLGAAADPGRRAVALALAVTAAERGRSVVLLGTRSAEDGGIAALLGIRAAPGLDQYLSGEASPRRVMRTIHVVDGDRDAAFVCVPAGKRGLEGDDPGLSGLIERLRRLYDLVLVDAGALRGGERTAAGAAGAAVICARAGAASGRGLERLRRSLGGAPVLGGLLLVAGGRDR